MSSALTVDTDPPHLGAVHLLEQGQGISHQDLLTALSQQDLYPGKQHLWSGSGAANLLKSLIKHYHWSGRVVSELV